MSRANRDGYYRVNNWLVREYGATIGALAVAVYDCYAVHANRDGICWPKAETIAAMLNIHRNTVTKATKTLKEYDLLRRIGTRAGGVPIHQLVSPLYGTGLPRCTPNVQPEAITAIEDVQPVAHVECTEEHPMNHPHRSFLAVKKTKEENPLARTARVQRQHQEQEDLYFEEEDFPFR